MSKIERREFILSLGLGVAAIAAGIPAKEDPWEGWNKRAKITADPEALIGSEVIIENSPPPAPWQDMEYDSRVSVTLQEGAPDIWMMPLSILPDGLKNGFTVWKAYENHPTYVDVIYDTYIDFRKPVDEGVIYYIYFNRISK